MTMNNIQKNIASRFMRRTIHNRVKDMMKENSELTIDNIFTDIKDEALDIFYTNGFTKDEIREMIENSIETCKCRK